MRATVLVLIMSLCAGIVAAQERPPQSRQEPPPQAFEDCRGKKAGETVQHATPEGTVPAVCEDTPSGLVARPVRGQQGRSPLQDASKHTKRHEAAKSYSLEQATSAEAQLHTIAFNGLAFLTGDFGSATFFPPGKVADFFGFQYMRDIDAAGKGHNPLFLDCIAGNVLLILTAQQRMGLERAARDEEALLQEIALKRFPLVAAFYRELKGDLPQGCSGLERKAVVAYCADIFALDATLAYRRAQAFGALAASLTSGQKQALGRLTFGNFNTWPDVDREEVRRLGPHGASKLVSVGYMTLASEFFSWYAGSLEADAYFCPERHGTYFGGFYLKDMPAMGQKNYDISTSFTGDLGTAFMDVLNANQRFLVTELLSRQGKTLGEIVEVRRTISSELRRFLRAEDPSERVIIQLGRRYGQLDGELAYDYAKAFVEINRTLDAIQKERLKELRSLQSREERTAFIYSDRVATPAFANPTFLLGCNKK